MSLTTRLKSTLLGVLGAGLLATACADPTTPPVPVASIAVAPTGFVLEVGKTRQLTARLFDTAGNRLPDRVVTWQTDSPDVASVNEKGLVGAAGPGYATIFATCEGKTFSLAVTVVEASP